MVKSAFEGASIPIEKDGILEQGQQNVDDDTLYHFP
jgi:hypothetical protein